MVPQSPDPIVRSVLDLDVYKLFMAQVILAKEHSDVPVRYQMVCRTPDVDLRHFIDIGELREQIQHVQSLGFRVDEIEYLWKDLGFPRSFANRLHRVNLPTPTIETSEGRTKEIPWGIDISVEGSWVDSIWWETIILSIVNELYSRGRLKKDSAARSKDDLDRVLRTTTRIGEERLMRKIEALKPHPRLTFIEFGTRRRFSGQWQQFVDEALMNELPTQMVGTSNVNLSRLFGTSPSGTIAHEMFMVYAAISTMGINPFTDDLMRNPDGISMPFVQGAWDSVTAVLRDWWEVLGQPYSIALTDTFGTNSFLKDFNCDYNAERWKGVRQDSGDPFKFVNEKVIPFYESIGVDPFDKWVIFSDGLDVEKIIALWEEFHKKVWCGFGWGTTLTNDMGIDTLSLVMKAVAVGDDDGNWHPTVKLSDNPAKAIGPPELIEAYKRTFQAEQDEREECKV